MKKKILSIIIVLSMVCIFIPTISIAETYGNLTYYEYTDGIRITIGGCGESATGDLVIPDKIDGFQVVSIEPGAFSGCSGLTSITIPDSVIKIGEGAFGDCSSLTSL